VILNLEGGGERGTVKQTALAYNANGNILQGIGTGTSKF